MAYLGYGPQLPQLSDYGLSSIPKLDSSPTQSNNASWFGPISKGLTLASNLVGAFSMFEASGSYKNQARQFERMGEQVLDEAFTQGIDIQREGRQITGTMTAMFGKSGSLLEGSPLLVLADTSARIQENIDRTIQQGRILQAQYLEKARQARKAARSAKLGGIGQVFGAVGVLAGGPFGAIGAGFGLASQF